ncbi:hypothetical protein AB0395_34755 [Streptosporangium sp. NPDC051023]|uniref:hypothetical protein n=1 Tax=Streptosporangium sp. NPDC051023 TaxID=3155410 RepID=UPI00344C3770
MRYYDPADLDEQARETLTTRAANFDLNTDLREGDFVDFADGVTRRVSSIFDGTVQTSDTGCGYYLGEGYVQMGNGSLYQSVPADTLTLTDERRPGTVWFSRYDDRGAGTGIQTQIAFRVYTCSLPAPTV